MPGLKSSDAAETVTPAAIITLRIIEVLATAPQGMRLTNLAQRLGMPKARAFRHLSVLREHGYVLQDASTSHYRIGWKLYLLGRGCVDHFNVIELARPILEGLRDAVGQTIVIATFNEAEVVVIDFLRGTAPIDITLRPGTRFPLNAVAQGKVVLANGPSELLQGFVEGPLQSCTSRTIADPSALKVEIAKVKLQGWADAPEELFTGINALAAPLFQADGTLFGTVAIVGSIHYLPREPEPQTVQSLVQTAQAVSAALGYSQPGVTLG
jgi:DNA-binding IclR family transcriptional regulator